jgi:hypothetical protein
MKFATAADAAGSTQYTTGVTYNGTPGSAGAYTQIVVAASAPTLYYYCHYHASMGGTANTPAEAATTSMRYKVQTKNQSYTAASGNLHTGTLYGNTAYNTSYKKFGTHSLKFVAAGDYVSFPDHADWDLASGDLTIDFWIYFVAMPSGNSTMVVSRWNGSGNKWATYFQPSGNISVGIIGSSELATGSAYTTGQWYHIAYVRSGSTTTMYKNGTSVGSGTGTYFNDDSVPLILGNHSTYAGNMYLDEIRISDTARWTSNFTSPTVAYTTDANTKLLIHGDGNVTDFSYVAESGKVTRIHGTSLAWS